MAKKQLGNIKDCLLPYEKVILYDGTTDGIILSGQEVSLSDSIRNYDQIIVQMASWRNTTFHITELCITDIMTGGQENLTATETFVLDCYQCMMMAPTDQETRIQFKFPSDTKLRLSYVSNTGNFTTGIRKVIGLRRPTSIIAPDYCFDERIVGKWVNGEDIYRITLPKLTASSSRINVGLATYNVKEIVKLDGIISALESNGVQYTFPIPYIYKLDRLNLTTTWYYDEEKSILIILAGTDLSNLNAKITIDYIKN